VGAYSVVMASKEVNENQCSGRLWLALALIIEMEEKLEEKN